MAESPVLPASVYVNLLNWEDYKRFWWVESESENALALHQTIGSDVVVQLKECEATNHFACLEIQPGFPLRLPCNEGALSDMLVSFPENIGVGLVSQRSNPIYGGPEYILEIGAGPTRVRVGYVYSVGVTFFLYLQEEKIDEDTAYMIPKSNAVYVANDDPFDPIPILCSE